MSLQGLAQDHIQTYLPVELKRTRLNVLCFMEPLAEQNSSHLGGRRGSQQNIHKQRSNAYGNNGTASGRRSGSSSLTDSETGKLPSGLPPPIPHDSPRGQERYMRVRHDPRRPSFRANSQISYVDNDDLR